MGDLRKFFVLMVGLGIGLWGQFAGAPSQFVDNLIAPLRELFGPDASTTGKLFGLGLAALAAVAIIDRIRKASSRRSLFQQRTPQAGEAPAIQPARIARVMGQQSAKEPPSESDNAYLVLQKTIAFAAAQVEHEAQMVQGRGKEAVSVRLVPRCQFAARAPVAGSAVGRGCPPACAGRRATAPLCSCWRKSTAQRCPRDCGMGLGRVTAGSRSSSSR